MNSTLLKAVTALVPIDMLFVWSEGSFFRGERLSGTSYNLEVRIMADEIDEIYDVTADHGPEAIGFVTSHPLLTKYIIATVLTFHRSGDWEKNANELEIRSDTAQYPDTKGGIDAVRDLLTKAGIDIRRVSTLRNAQSGDAHTNPDDTLIVHYRGLAGWRNYQTL
jgi:hypothetical protein